MALSVVIWACSCLQGVGWRAGERGGQAGSELSKARGKSTTMRGGARVKKQGKEDGNSGSGGQKGKCGSR